MKLAGTIKYPWGAASVNDSAALGFNTEPEAQRHADVMNSLRELYDDPTYNGWNKKYWTAKPEAWIVFNADQLT